MNLYGFRPDLVIRMRKCRDFIELLNWRGSMKGFLMDSYGGSYFDLTFPKVFLKSPLVTIFQYSHYMSLLSVLRQSTTTVRCAVIRLILQP